MTQVQHNMNAINAYNRLNANVAGLKKASEKLASGYRINRAGDDAAGLAISEKMRSQIKGLNQAVRNSQDGINMIQTYEGAAQETHSILQRMKELAVESANGTYDNATDRAAIQLEFDQLNDELNQIADTDFNGTVVLNGGVMADGTVAKDGEFRYADGYTETVVADKATDISGAQADTIADQSTYNKTTADAVWAAVGADVTKNETLDVTFMFDGERWVADTVTDGNGKIVDGARASGLEAKPVNRDDASGKGGFKVIAGKDPMTGKDIVATNAIFDEMTPVKKGDTVTIRFENDAAKTYAPKNIGLDEDYNGVNKAFKLNAAATITQSDMIGKVTVELSSAVKDEAMTEDFENVLKALDAMDIKVTYEEGEATTFAKVAPANAADLDADVTAALGKLDFEDNNIVYTADDGTKTTIATINAAKMTKVTVASDADGKVATGTVGNDLAIDADNTSLKLNAVDTIAKEIGGNTITLKYNGGQSKWQYDSDGAGTMKDVTLANLGITTTGTAQNNDTLTITYTPAVEANDAATDIAKEGEVTFSLNVDAFHFADMEDLSVHAVATPKVATMASQVATPGVSAADSFNNSTGVLTYTDNLTLQTGARTKDSVNFAFSYNTDGTADMGNLVSNLDLSARSTGLNTASLSLADQKSANYAIDQIDKAINKTSMVRATFGSIQNRLEHKITNLTTTSENLTEAESSIRDTDMASEMMNYTKFNILQQAAQSMLAQANQQPQSILQLLG